MYTKPLTKLSIKDIATAGGKGASLGELLRADIPVPNGFVVLTSAFDKFLNETDLRQELRAQLNKVDQDKMYMIERLSERIQSMILRADMPQEIAQAILKDFNTLNVKYVAVRSSATVEDSDSATWAGQFETYLNTIEKTLLENVKKCWASLFTPRAIFYRFEKGLKENNISMAVVVQEMIESEKSGIAFSVHPVTEDKNQIIIEAGIGLGEAVVSGVITPDSYVVSKKDNKIIDINVHKQVKALYRKEGGGSEWKNLGKKGVQQVLSKKDILKLAEIVKKIENHYNIPQDIEWAFVDGKFYITQSRSITTLKITKSVKNKKVKKDYELHFTVDSANFNILVLDMIFSNTNDTYGAVDYVVVYNQDVVRAYLSNKGLDKAYEISKYLLDDNFFKRFVKRAKSLDFSFRNYKSPILTDDNIYLEWKKNLSLSYSSSQIYGFLEQPFQQALEQEILKTISREELIEILSHEHFDKLPDAKTKKYVERLLEMGKLKLKLHEDSEKFFTDDIFLEYVSKKYNLPMEIVGAMRVSEFEKAMRGKLIITADELKERLKGCVFVKENDKWNLCTGEQYDYWKNKMRGIYDSEVTGDVAFSGVAKGRVAIHLSWTDITKVKDGDVLVTGMTNPQMIPLLKKVSAIITDEGGITCHAAIISRELKKPCIVGTKNATQVLENGDLVEVNASNGSIGVIKKIGSKSSN